MLSSKYEVTEITNSNRYSVERFKTYTVRLKFNNAEILDFGFDEKQDALEWYALWSGLAKQPACYNGVVAYASWIIKNIDREKALFFFYSSNQQAIYLRENFVKEYFLEDEDAFSDNFDERHEEIEDVLINYYPVDNLTPYGNRFALCDTVELLYFDTDKLERREMRVSYA